MKRICLITSLILFSPLLWSVPAQEKADDFIHPYEVIKPQEQQSLFDMMEEEPLMEEKQEEQEDPQMRDFEDQRKIPQ